MWVAADESEGETAVNRKDHRKRAWKFANRIEPWTAYVIDTRTGVIRLHPKCGRAVYKQLKRRAHALEHETWDSHGPARGQNESLAA